MNAARHRRTHIAPRVALERGSRRAEIDRILDPRAGYDKAARAYDRWHWQALWNENETPEVLAWVSALPPGRALDVGSGTGRYMGILRRLNHDVAGVDLSSEMLARAAENLGTGRGLHEADARALPFVSSRFDLVLCCRVLSHVQELGAALSELARVARPGGLVIVTDVDGRHDYEATRVPVDGENVFIRVFKHPAETVVSTARASGLRPIAHRLVYARDLARPPTKTAFPGIDWTNRRPLFFTAAFAVDG